MELTNLRSVAFVFPGQGSQAIGMLSDFIDEYPVVMDTYSEASDYLGYDLWSVIENGPEAELNKTEVTQPALLTSGVAQWRLWQQMGGIMPTYMAGHSLGEYTALVCADSIKFNDAVTLVRDRGIFMQETISEGNGAMAVIIGMAIDEVKRVCNIVTADYGTVVPANYNTAEQIVIAGYNSAVTHAIKLAREIGAKRALLLPVSVPSHCVLMEPAANKLADRLEEIDISDAIIPVVQNVDAIHHQNSIEIKRGLIKQLCQPVLWIQTIQYIADLHCTSIIESGPGRILSGLIRRIDRDIDCMNLNNVESFKAVITRNKT